MFHTAGTPRVVIAIPSYDRWHAEFGMDLVQLVRCTDEDDVNFDVLSVQATYLPQARHMLAQEALKASVSHVFWLDSDQRFPADALVRLLQHDRMVVGANYRRRRPPHTFVAQKNDVPLPTTPESRGLEEVHHIGFGCLLTHTDTLRSPKPRFQTPWLPGRDGPRILSEDYAYCELVRADGIPIYVDHDLSKEVGHLGQRVVTTL